MAVKAISHQRLKEILSYDPETGRMTWLVKPAKRYAAGSQAGGLHKSTGYWRINVDGACWLGHRLAWFYMTGQEPPAFIDHKDGDRLNNVWSNLRATDHSHNMQNLKKATSRSKIGALGVQHRSPGSFRASINVNGKDQTIGHFPTIEAASAAYIAAKRSLHAGCTL